jgi:hypothetical protein
MNERKLVYLTGPMLGLPDLNRPAFAAYAAALRSKGYVVVSATEIEHDDMENDESLAADSLRAMAGCNIVSYLPDWKPSARRTLELLGANQLDLPAVELDASFLFDPTEGFDLLAFLTRNRIFSLQTFGPDRRVNGICDHIRKELVEIEAEDGPLSEWIDVIILGFDGANRTGASPEQIVEALVAKQIKNEGRSWPDWRTSDPDKAIEHDRSAHDLVNKA